MSIRQHIDKWVSFADCRVIFWQVTYIDGSYAQLCALLVHMHSINLAHVPEANNPKLHL